MVTRAVRFRYGPAFMGGNAMTAIVSLNPDMAEFDLVSGGEEHEMRLVLTDTDGLHHSLTLTGPAIRELVPLVRAIQEAFPDALAGH